MRGFNCVHVKREVHDKVILLKSHIFVKGERRKRGKWRLFNPVYTHPKNGRHWGLHKWENAAYLEKKYALCQDKLRMNGIYNIGAAYISNTNVMGKRNIWVYIRYLSYI